MPTATEPSSSYAVGLTEAGLPDLIAVGVSHEVGMVMLTKLAKQSIAGELEAGRRYDIADGGGRQQHPD